jgi:hypothetical protein
MKKTVGVFLARPICQNKDGYLDMVTLLSFQSISLTRRTGQADSQSFGSNNNRSRCGTLYGKHSLNSSV